MNKRLKQLVLYGGTAGTAAVVDIGGFALLNDAGVSLVLAAALSFMVATVCNYFLTARFVFDAGISWRGYGKFLSAASLGFLINVGVTTIAASMFGLLPVLAKTVGVGIAFFANFALNALFVFKPKTPAEQEGER